MKPKILLVNPPIHDFSAYDFWLKPYGLLRVAGQLRGQAHLRLFDYLDREAPDTKDLELRLDPWGRGEFYSQELAKPAALAKIPRRYRRFGRPQSAFRKYLEREGPFEFALIQTVMTYWYPGVREVIQDLRACSPQTKLVLGGVYATLCPAHAQGLGVDLVVSGLELAPLWRFLNLTPRPQELPYWEGYEKLSNGVLKLADGCPFRCTYCSVPQVYPTFHGQPLERSLGELEFLVKQGAQNIVFYDDALLFRTEEILTPFLRASLAQGWRLNFHTPNALNARFITPELAHLMVQAGFKQLYLGFESSAYEWQKKTGGKVYSAELAQAVENLLAAGVERSHITAYLILAHPQARQQHVEDSMRFAHDLGIRVMLSEFSPIPGTPDGEACRPWVDLEEPLHHNKTAFPILFLGEAEVDRMKDLARRLNRVVGCDRVSALSTIETAERF